MPNGKALTSRANASWFPAGNTCICARSRRRRSVCFACNVTVPLTANATRASVGFSGPEKKTCPWSRCVPGIANASRRSMATAFSNKTCSGHGRICGPLSKWNGGVGLVRVPVICCSCANTSRWPCGTRGRANSVRSRLGRCVASCPAFCSSLAHQPCHPNRVENRPGGAKAGPERLRPAFRSYANPNRCQKRIQLVEKSLSRVSEGKPSQCMLQWMKRVVALSLGKTQVIVGRRPLTRRRV